MAFLSNLFRVTPSDAFAAAAERIVSRLAPLTPVAPDLTSFQAALETAHGEVTGQATDALSELRNVAALLADEKYALAIVRARDVMSRHPSVMASCLGLIGAAYHELRFYRSAIRHFAAAARIDGQFDAMAKNFDDVHRALNASPACRLSRMVLAVLTTDAFDPVIDGSTDTKEVAGALLARGEVARRLGAPHLALLDFGRAVRLGQQPSAKAMFVLAAADWGDAEAGPFAVEAQQLAGFVELDSRLSTVLPEWERAAREEWRALLPRLEALEA